MQTLFNQRRLIENAIKCQIVKYKLLRNNGYKHFSTIYQLKVRFAIVTEASVPNSKSRKVSYTVSLPISKPSPS